jgi:hypothetical protein
LQDREKGKGQGKGKVKGQAKGKGQGKAKSKAKSKGKCKGECKGNSEGKANGTANHRLVKCGDIRHKEYTRVYHSVYALALQEGEAARGPIFVQC